MIGISNKKLLIAGEFFAGPNVPGITFLTIHSNKMRTFRAPKLKKFL